MLATRYPLRGEDVGQERILGVLYGIAVADDGDRKLPVAVIRLHLVIPADRKVHGDRPLPAASNQFSVSCRMPHLLTPK